MYMKSGVFLVHVIPFNFFPSMPTELCNVLLSMITFLTIALKYIKDLNSYNLYVSFL